MSGLAVDSAPATSRTLVDEVLRQVESCRSAAGLRGLRLVPPTLAMGVFERVGSNWFLESTGSPGAQHNEPFRQQLHPSHCLSALSRRLVSSDEIDAGELDPVAVHWLVAFVASKYDVTRHVVKETNLFFAANGFLRLFPDAPVVVLLRNPVGIASSFKRGGLFERWAYAERYEQLRHVALQPTGEAYGFAFPEDEPNEIQALARLIVLNGVLLASALADRPHSTVSYEDRFRTQPAARLLGLEPDRCRRPVLDDTFDTTHPPTRLVNCLDEGETELLDNEVQATLARVATVVEPPVLNEARSWLSQGRGAYEAAATAARPPLRPPESTPSTARTSDARYESKPGGAWWRTTLVTNAEACEILTALRAAGAPNVVAGIQLFVNEAMPHERGGRIRFDPHSGAYMVSAGYEAHPVYWVTWLGAAAIAFWEAARLPTWQEMTTLVDRCRPDLDRINANHRLGDVSPVVAGGVPPGEIHHVVGNLRVWCAEGPPARPGGLRRAYFHGAAWDTPATPDEINRQRSRHLTGCSRGIGIRLVRDTASPRPTAVEDLAHQIRSALASLTTTGPGPVEQERQLVQAVTGGAPCYRPMLDFRPM